MKPPTKNSKIAYGTLNTNFNANRAGHFDQLLIFHLKKPRAQHGAFSFSQLNLMNKDLLTS